MRIAIVRLSAMGDIINSAFVLQFIKEHYPHASIEWFSEKAFAPILEKHPYIDKVHIVNLKEIKKERSLKKLIQLIKRLKSLTPYDKVIDLQGLVKSALLSRYLGNDRYGYDKRSIREPFASHFYQHKCTISYAENSIWRSAELVNFTLNTNITKDKISQKTSSLQVDYHENIEHLLSKPTILFVVGSSQAYKNYPVEKIAQTIEKLGTNVLLIWGSLAEYDDAKRVASLSPNAIVAPKLTLSELKFLVSQSQLMIGNDTGPTHLAWALNRPSITLFGATPASKMMWETKINIPLESSSFIDPLKLNKRDFSIQDIKPDIIAQTAKRLLDATR